MKSTIDQLEEQVKVDDLMDPSPTNLSEAIKVLIRIIQQLVIEVNAEQTEIDDLETYRMERNEQR